MGNLFKDIGHEVSKGSKSIGNVFKGGANKIENAVSDVYNDTKTAIGYTGKHLINDVDNISSTLSNPMLYIIGGIVVVVV